MLCTQICIRYMVNMLLVLYLFIVWCNIKLMMYRKIVFRQFIKWSRLSKQDPYKHIIYNILTHILIGNKYNFWKADSKNILISINVWLSTWMYFHQKYRKCNHLIYCLCISSPWVSSVDMKTSRIAHKKIKF